MRRPIDDSRRRLACASALLASAMLCGCSPEPNVCERSLVVTRPISESHCATIEGCAWCDCILAPDSPGCDVHERDARWIARCHDDPENAEFAQSCLDGDPACQETIESLIDLGCANAP